jgi:hypothetical protein
MPSCNTDRVIDLIASDLSASSVHHPHRISDKAPMRAVAALFGAVRKLGRIRMCVGTTPRIYHGAN